MVRAAALVLLALATSACNETAPRLWTHDEIADIASDVSADGRPDLSELTDKIDELQTQNEALQERLESLRLKHNAVNEALTATQQDLLNVKYKLGLPLK